MGKVVVSARRHTPVRRTELFSRFGSGDAGGWLFDCSCDVVEPGAAIMLSLPIDGQTGGPVVVFGRIGRIRYPSLIEIQHDQPWRGRLVVRMTDDPDGTLVTLQEELDEEGLRWLMRRRGHVLRHASSRTTPLGLLTSKSGSGSLFGAAVDGMAALAVDEINAERRHGTAPIELLVGDDATDSATGVAEARRLAASGCRTILVATASHTYRAVAQALRGTGVLLVYAIMNEGSGAGRLQIQLGERPLDQIRTAAPELMRRSDGRRWFLAGNDYIWPRAMHRTARRVLPGQGGQIAGEALVPLGSVDFTRVIEALHASDADLLLSTFVGQDSAVFQRQLHAAGLSDRYVTLAPALDESTLARIGVAASRGVHAVSGYVGTLQTPANVDLQRRYRERFGPWAAPLSTLSEAVYEAILLWWTAARAVGVDDPVAIADTLRSGSHDLPRGRVVLDGHGRVSQRMRFSRAAGIALQTLQPG
ncbi:ABC transporter substrate-binding protein [Nakamurella flava]|uniref:ABC transporter substrate-binding protein n=1 Tax=Nakamurella flava TaxID=2576308 RepID=A0A4U6QBL8_9ACTN|nr:substrate-binding protein [Nakamurella flava]TKV57299.1 ABC transporter substrate-binding protein [Nakamurella flava]